MPLTRPLSGGLSTSDPWRDIATRNRTGDTLIVDCIGVSENDGVAVFKRVIRRRALVGHECAPDCRAGVCGHLLDSRIGQPGSPVRQLPGWMIDDLYVRGFVQMLYAGRLVAPYLDEVWWPLPRGSAAVRLCMAADVAAYSQRTNPAAEQVQHVLVMVLGWARRYAGIDESEVARQQHGDGELAVFPIGIDESIVIPRLIDGLGIALAGANRF